MREPIDFGASDGEPVDLVFAMAVPEHFTQEHLQLLAQIAEQFADAGFRDALRAAPDAAALRTCCWTRRRARTSGARRMTQRISAQELFDLHRERLGLRWVAGQSGAQRVLESVDTVARRPSLAGYLNIIYPNKVQILGTEELHWLDGLDSRAALGSDRKIMRCAPARAGDQQGPARAGRPARGGGGNRNAAVGLAAPRA